MQEFNLDLTPLCMRQTVLSSLPLSVPGQVLTQGRICTLLVLLWSAVWSIPYKGEKMVGQGEI